LPTAETARAIVYVVPEGVQAFIEGPPRSILKSNGKCWYSVIPTLVIVISLVQAGDSLLSMRKQGTGRTDPK
jgi:hypothetical protein